MPQATRIVIAEDEAIIRLDLREMLEEEGYDVVGEAGDGETAMRLTEELRPDLVILDIFMPGVDGLTVAQRIAERELSAVLILTAFSQRDLVDRASRGGAMAYVVKPFEKQDLIPAIELAVARWVETRALGRETKDLAERLETRRLVERAKGILMDRLGMSEHEAFKMIQRASMRRRVNMREVADRIIGGSLDGLESTR